MGELRGEIFVSRTFHSLNRWSFPFSRRSYRFVSLRRRPHRKRGAMLPESWASRSVAIRRRPIRIHIMGAGNGIGSGM